MVRILALRVWLPLTKDLRNQGLSDVTASIMRGNETWDNNGKLGKCFYANGVNTLQINNIIPQLYNINGYSLCAWFYIESQNTVHSGAGIISGGNWNNQVLNLSVSDWSSDHYTRLRVSGTNWNNNYIYNFYKNTWYHAVVCSDGNKTYAYINGQLIGDTVAGFLPSSIEGNNIAIGGATYYSGMQFFGKINDVRIYDHCLSPMEVKQISQGLVLHYRLADPYIESSKNLCTVTRSGEATDSTWGGHVTQWKFYDSTNDPVPFKEGLKAEIVYGQNGSTGGGASKYICAITVSPSTTYTYSCYIKASDDFEYTHQNFLYVYENTASGSGVTQFGYFNKERMERIGNGWYRIWGSFTTQSTTEKVSLYNYTYPSKTVNYWFGGWQIEQKDHVTPFMNPNSERNESTVWDCSGFGNNGVKIGGISWSSDTPRYSGSYEFDGGNTCITFPYDYTALQTNFTMNIWFKKNELGSKNYETLIGGTSVFEMDTRSGASTTLSLYMASTRGGSVYAPFNMGEWYMVTLVNDGTNELYYVNGQLQKTIEKKPMPSSSTYYIGSWRGVDSQNYKGLMSDFRIYATALSADDILSLYNLGGSLDSNGTFHTYEYVEV